MEHCSKVAEYWNNASDEWYRDIDSYLEEIVKSPSIAFPKPVYQLLSTAVPDLIGKKVCVPSSGDNTAAFAFHLLGAQVTSVDISERQLLHAAKAADRMGWDISFVRDDSMSLSKLEAGSFDLVYTSNGTHVWISDLSAMYANIHRILKEGGSSVFFDTHPMTRPFDSGGGQVKIIKHYGNTGPFLSGEGVGEFAWRMQDFINAIAENGFTVKRLEEFHSSPNDLITYDYIYNTKEERERDQGKRYDWTQNPWAALPQCFALWAKKLTGIAYSI